MTPEVENPLPQMHPFNCCYTTVVIYYSQDIGTGTRRGCPGPVLGHRLFKATH